MYFAAIAPPKPAPITTTFGALLPGIAALPASATPASDAAPAIRNPRRVAGHGSGTCEKRRGDAVNGYATASGSFDSSNTSLIFVVLIDVDRHFAAADEPAEQQLVGERLADRVLDQTRHRPRAHLRIEALAAPGTPSAAA